MLSPADKALADRDPALRGLATVLDRDAVAALLRSLRPEIEPSALRADYVRYKRRTNCLVGYRLEIDGAVIPLVVQTHDSNSRDKLL